MANEHLAWFRSAGRGMECENVSFGRRADTKPIRVASAVDITHPSINEGALKMRLLLCWGSNWKATALAQCMAPMRLTSRAYHHFLAQRVLCLGIGLLLESELRESLTSPV